MIEGISPEIKIIIVSMLPIFEVRGALPLAIQIYGMHWFEAFIISVTGNIAPVIPILLILNPVSKFLKRYQFFNKIDGWLIEHKQKKNDIIEKYETIGLMIFVSIPLPILGVWSASFIAYFLGVKLWHAFISISLGVFISGTIALSLIKTGWISAIFAALVLIGMTSLGIAKIMFKSTGDHSGLE